MNRAIVSQLGITIVIAIITISIGRNMHSLGGIVLFAVGVLATLLCAFRTRTLRLRALGTRSKNTPSSRAKNDSKGS